ncbi:MAG: SDR family NAD(P)-dependent oxidoreductase [Gammaproteobacteria bacterium]
MPNQTQNSVINPLILITGASRGIGRALSLALAQAGFQLILLARSIPALNTLYEEILSLKTAPAPYLYPMNLINAQLQDYENLAAQIKHEFGRLDGLILNAGAAGHLSPLEHHPEEQWFTSLQLNLTSKWLLIKHLLPLLKQSKDAHIVFNINQAAKNKAFWGAYGLAQSATSNLAQTLKAELEAFRHIQIHEVYPKPTGTHLRREAFPAENADSLLKPEEAAIQHFMPIFCMAMPHLFQTSST